MDFHKEFISQKNKELIWNILYENKMFEGIPKENVPKVQDIFEKSIFDLNRKTEYISSLIDINKKAIAYIVESLKELKKVPKKDKPLEQTKINKPFVNRTEQTNEMFQERQNEFINSMTIKTQQEIDFSDKNESLDAPLEETKLNSLIEETIKQRELDISTIATTTENKKLVVSDINDISDLNEIPSENKKSVTWEDERYPDNNMKKFEGDLKELISQNNQIVDNLNSINQVVNKLQGSIYKIESLLFQDDSGE